MNKRTSAGLRRAISYCEQAIAIDKRYASAYACLADCYFLLGFQNVMPCVEAMPKAKAAAEPPCVRIDITT